MKYIKIFLAMSEADMKEEKAELANYIRSLNDLYVGRGIFFEICGPGEKDAEYIDESQYFFLLFYREADEQIIRDFDVAIEKFNVSAAPKIVTYFKIAEDNSISEGVRSFMERLEKGMEHFYNKFDNIDTVKLSMLLEMARNQETKLDIEFKDGKILADKKEVEDISLDNIPQYFKNEALNKLREERLRLEEEYIELSKAIGENPDDDELSKKRYDINERKNEADKQFHQIEMDILRMTSNIVEMTSEGKPLTVRAKKAIEYFNAGDYENCKNILDDEERRRAWERADEKEAVINEEREGLINEIRIKVGTIKAQGINSESEKEIIELYEEAKGKIFEYGLDIAFTVDYVAFLYKQKNYEDGLEIGEQVRCKLYNEKKNPDLYLQICQIMGNLYKDTSRYTKALEMFNETFEVCKKLNEMNMDIDIKTVAIIANDFGNIYMKLRYYERAEDMYKIALALIMKSREISHGAYILYLKAMVFYNLSYLYVYTNCYEKYEDAERMYLEALDIFKKLRMSSKNLYAEEIAYTFAELGKLYSETDRFKKAEIMHKEALSIRRELSAINRSKYIESVADTYLDLGITYDRMAEFEKAEELYKEAITLYRELIIENRGVYMPNLAHTYIQLVGIYMRKTKYKEAECFLKEAYEMQQDLDEFERKTHIIDIAKVYNNLGLLYVEIKRNEEAEVMYEKALEIYRELCQENDSVFIEYFASTSLNLGALYYEMKKFTEAESRFKESLDIYRKLSKRNRKVHMEDIAKCCNNLGILYMSGNKYEEGEKLLKESVEIYRALSEKNRSAYIENCAVCCNNLGRLYIGMNEWEKAERLYKDALKIYEELSEVNYSKYIEKVADIYSSLGAVYKEMGRYIDSRSVYESAFNIYNSLQDVKTNQYKEKVSLIIYNLSVLKQILKNHK